MGHTSKIKSKLQLLSNASHKYIMVFSFGLESVSELMEKDANELGLHVMVLGSDNIHTLLGILDGSCDYIQQLCFGLNPPNFMEEFGNQFSVIGNDNSYQKLPIGEIDNSKFILFFGCHIEKIDGTVFFGEEFELEYDRVLGDEIEISQYLINKYDEVRDNEIQD